MRTLWIATLCLALAAPIGGATADDDDDDKRRWRGGYSRHHDGHKGRERKVEYDDGRCKVERKWKKSGEYKEEIKCRGGGPPGHGGYRPHPGRFYDGPPPHGYGGYPGYGYGYR